MEPTTVSEQETHPSNQKKTSPVIKWALIIGIAIVANLFISYVVTLLYPAPEYTTYCPEKQVNNAILSEAACLEVGGQWNENQAIDMDRMPQAAGYCNEDFSCSKLFEDANGEHTRNVFLVFVVSGILLLVGSVFLQGAAAVSLGLSFAGVLALFLGSVRYWGYMNSLLQVVILGLALAALIFVAYKKFRD